MLGWCYAEGVGVEKSLSDAVESYHKAAVQGHGEGMLVFAVHDVFGQLCIHNIDVHCQVARAGPFSNKCICAHAQAHAHR